MRLILLPAFCAAVFLAATPAPGDDGPAYPDFTFKREKAPPTGTIRRKIVQIDPEEQAAILAARPKPQPLEPTDPNSIKPKTPGGEGTARGAPRPSDSKAAYPWFWASVPSGLRANTSDRLRAAFLALSDGPGGKRVSGPRLQALQTIARDRGADILRATIGTDVSPALVLAVIAVESSGRADAQSHAGAQGLMQLMPATAKRFGVGDSLAPDQNIRGGVAYLDWLLQEFDGDAVLALAGYNAGEGAVKKHSGVPPYVETRDYVPKVLAAFQVAGALCKTRPQLITDACALDLASFSVVSNGG
ncbi:MAG: lytic transglycosylase domain-containing protein [Pseudomonadota bacterium]